jgi:hypothetical protein
MAFFKRRDPSRPWYETYPYALVVCSVGSPAEHGQLALAALGFLTDSDRASERITLREARLVRSPLPLTLDMLTLFHAIGGQRTFDVFHTDEGEDEITVEALQRLVLGDAQEAAVTLLRPIYVLEIAEPVRERLRPPHLRLPPEPSPASPPASPPATP